VSTLTIPNTFVNGTTINAAPFNSNFGAITTWSTAIDNTNIGPAGLFPNQLLPTTGAQATFGATAVGVGYKFLANDATATPLTVSGVSGQSADILDVTLTSGGTNAFKIASAGAATFQFLVTMNNALSVAGNITTTAGDFVGLGLLLTTATPTASAGQVAFGTTTGTTVGAAGIANALPVNPQGYLTINVSGSNFKIPYYNP